MDRAISIPVNPLTIYNSRKCASSILDGKHYSSGFLVEGFGWRTASYEQGLFPSFDVYFLVLLFSSFFPTISGVFSLFVFNFHRNGLVMDILERDFRWEEAYVLVSCEYGCTGSVFWFKSLGIRISLIPSFIYFPYLHPGGDGIVKSVSYMVVAKRHRLWFILSLTNLLTK